MLQTPDTKTVFFAQVGFTYNDLNTSLIGIRHDQKVELMETPRVVVLEPPEKNNTYDSFHEHYDEKLEEIRIQLGEKANLLQVIRGDIYDSESLSTLPPIAFLVLEDVLSDPYYKGSKDFEELIKLMQNVMISGGVILTLDSKLSGFSDGVKDLIQSFMSLVLSSGNFTVILNLLDFEWGTENIKKRDSNLPSQTIMTELDKLKLVDAALKEGLDTLRLGVYHCLVLQKI
jgi:hypothetical protein